MELSFVMYLLAPNGTGGCHAVAVANGERFAMGNKHWRINTQLTRFDQQMFTSRDERALFEQFHLGPVHNRWLNGREIFLYVPVVR